MTWIDQTEAKCDSLLGLGALCCRHQHRSSPCPAPCLVKEAHLLLCLGSTPSHSPTPPAPPPSPGAGPPHPPLPGAGSPLPSSFWAEPPTAPIPLFRPCLVQEPHFLLGGVHVHVHVRPRQPHLLRRRRKEGKKSVAAGAEGLRAVGPAGPEAPVWSPTLEVATGRHPCSTTLHSLSTPLNSALLPQPPREKTCCPQQPAPRTRNRKGLQALGSTAA